MCNDLENFQCDEWAWFTAYKRFYCIARNGFVNFDFQHLTLILGFCAPKNGDNGLIPKNYCSIE